MKQVNCEHKWNDQQLQIMMTHPQDLFSKNIKRNSMCERKSKSSMESVSPTTSMENLSETSIENNVHIGRTQVFTPEIASFAHESKMLPTEQTELPAPGTFGLSKTQSEMALMSQSCSSQEHFETLSFPKHSEKHGLVKSNSMSLDSLCQTTKSSKDDRTLRSSKSAPTPTGSESPQLDQLLSDLEEMKLKFRPEVLDPPLSLSRDECPENNESYKCKDLSPRDEWSAEGTDEIRDNMSPFIPLAEDTIHTNEAVKASSDLLASIQNEPVTVTSGQMETSETSTPSDIGDKDTAELLSTSETPLVFCKVLESSVIKCDKNTTETLSLVSFDSVAAKNLSEQSDENLTDLFPECSTTDIPQSQEELELAKASNSLWGVTGEISLQSSQNQLPNLLETLSDQASHYEDVSSQSHSDLTPETVTSARHFSFEEPVPYDDLRASGKYSEDYVTQEDIECFATQASVIKPEMTLLPLGEENITSGSREPCSTTIYYPHMPTEDVEVVHNGADDSVFEYSDPEQYFDCKQASSDLSETETVEPDPSTRSSGLQLHDNPSHCGVLEKVDQRVMMSSESEDYEDAPLVHGPLRNLYDENKESLRSSEASDEEFTLCEPSQSSPVYKTGTFDDSDKYLTREVNAELGSMSESSEEEFLTTRIVRRRVVIQGDEMPDLPTQSVTEEKYKDENGHIVVKKVTRKIIRKCISADGVQHEQISVEGEPQGSTGMAEGDAYSKVVKRTIVKSEGDQTEVTFTESDGVSPSRQETDEGCNVSRVERITVVEGERTMTHQGDPSLASDLPSAKDDFTQALGYFTGFSRTELPHVVEKETVKEDGTVVRRAHMHKGRTLRRTVVRKAGQRKQVLTEQVDNPRKGSKQCDLQQHLRQLFHRYYEEDEEDNDEDEEEKNV